MKKLMFLFVALVVVAAGTATAERPVPAEKAQAEPNGAPARGAGPATRALDAPRQTTRASENFGTIIYDDGVVTAAPAISSFCYGNQFDSAAGTTVNPTGSVTQMSFYMVSGAGTDNVFLSVFGPVAGTAAPVLTSVSVPLNNGSAAFNTHTFGTPVAYAGGSFLAGVWYTGGDTVGLGSGTVAGQGHHGMLINDIVGTSFATLPGLNALVGASGDILIPVELMTFTVD